MVVPMHCIPRTELCLSSYSFFSLNPFLWGTHCSCPSPNPGRGCSPQLLRQVPRECGQAGGVGASTSASSQWAVQALHYFPLLVCSLQCPCHMCAKRLQPCCLGPCCSAHKEGRHLHKASRLIMPATSLLLSVCPLPTADCVPCGVVLNPL